MNASTRTRNRTWIRLAGAAVLTVALGAAVVGCSSKSEDKAAPQAASTTDVADNAVPSAPAQAQQVQSNGSQSNGGPSNGGGQPPAPSAPKPVISSFNTPENIDCHNGNFQNFSASWTTQNATKVTISIDGPGVYNTYAANGDTSLPFSCSSAHSFLLTAYGPGGHVSKSITLQPRNVQSDDDDE
jgi:hypothetical protein